MPLSYRIKPLVVPGVLVVPGGGLVPPVDGPGVLVVRGDRLVLVDPFFEFSQASLYDCQ